MSGSSITCSTGPILNPFDVTRVSGGSTSGNAVLVCFSVTVKPLYNDIRYNSKIRYNVNLVCTNISGSCIFSLIF